MTLTLEIAAETEAQIAAGAQASGRSIADYAAELLAQAAEDAADVAEVARARAEVKPGDLVTWEQLKAEAGL
jgi:plastocyanin